MVSREEDIKPKIELQECATINDEFEGELIAYRTNYTNERLLFFWPNRMTAMTKRDTINSIRDKENV